MKTIGKTLKASRLAKKYSLSFVEEKTKIRKGRVQIITNGGGYGIITTDNIANTSNLKMAKMSNTLAKILRKKFPSTVNIGNPLDLVGDAQSDRYEFALNYLIKDKNIDVLVLIVLIQTPIIVEDLEKIMLKYKKLTTKPIVAISTGSKKVESFLEDLQTSEIVTFNFPENAIKALDKLAWYEKKRTHL